MLTQLFERRLLVVLGKGGVGKSTLSAGLALSAARSGIRTLLMETDARAPIAAALGVGRSFEPIKIRGGLWTMVLDGGHALDEYLGLVLPARTLLKAVFANRLYQFFVQAAPGLRELMMLGKVYYEVERAGRARDAWELIVLDAPASGQAISLLRMPAATRATFGTSIVGQEADNIQRMLHDRAKCALIEVTTPDALAVSELLETQKALASDGLRPAAVFLNRAVALPFASADVATFSHRAKSIPSLHHVEQLADISKAELLRASYTPRARTAIARHTRSPILEIPEFAGEHGLALFSHLASFFAEGLNVDEARHGAVKGGRTAESGRNA